ncbi:MAG: hypothetical protein OEY29_02995 [Gammaproteobacteria bacterium]|nr:hypothetical protein [Gammaproteobacteria bacterium]
MPKTSPNYHYYIYGSIVTIGIITCLATIYTSAEKIQHFEHNTSRIHRLISLSEVELDTLDNEANIIENTLKSIQEQIESNQEVDKNVKLEFFTLKKNIDDLRTDIAEKQKLLISLNLLKTDTLSQVKTLFWINSFLLVFGTLMVLGGLSALIFKLEIFQDRRTKKRLKQQQPK